MAVGESPPHQEDRWRQDNNEMYEQTDEKWMKKEVAKGPNFKNFLTFLSHTFTGKMWSNTVGFCSRL
jgi:hypothetical protein